jgi:hypothetical protein
MKRLGDTTSQRLTQYFLQVHLDSAIEMLSPEIVKKLVQIAVSEGPEASFPVSTRECIQAKKPLVSQGFDEVFQIISSLGLYQLVGDEGLEPPTLSV